MDGDRFTDAFDDVRGFASYGFWKRSACTGGIFKSGAIGAIDAADAVEVDFTARG
jgi:hypothetical protein